MFYYGYTSVLDGFMWFVYPYHSGWHGRNLVTESDLILIDMGKIDWHVITKNFFHEICYMQYNRRLKIVKVIMKQSKCIISEFCAEEWFCDWVHMYVIYTACLSQTRVLSSYLCVPYLTLHDLSGNVRFGKDKSILQEKQYLMEGLDHNHLTHWGQVMHTCLDNLTITGSHNGL